MPPAPSDSPSGAGPAATPTPSRSKRALAWTASSYFGEGLPWTFLHQMGTDFLTATGASTTQIGATSLLHLAVTFKFAWSPLVDLFGKRRTWVVVLQFVLGAGMLAIAVTSASRNMTVFWSLMALLAIIHATHDIACDGFYLQALNKGDQALYSGVRIAAFRGAMFVGSLGLVYLASKTSWTIGFGAAGVLMAAVALLNAALMPRLAEPVATVGPKAPAQAGAFWLASLRSFLGQPQAALVLSFMFFYKLGDIMMFAMSKPLLRDIGIDLEHRSFLNGVGTAATIVGSISAGALIARVGLTRCLVPMTLFQNLAIPLYIAMAVFKPPFQWVIPIVMFEQFAAGVGAAAHVVFLMRRCRVAFSASHYAFATAIVSLGSSLSGFASGPLNQALGHPWFFTLAFVASWPSLILVLIVPTTSFDAVEAGPSTPR